jgi:hypothetical protein
VPVEDNFSLGVCDVNYGGVDLGETQGLVNVTIKENTLPKQEVLPFGNTPVEHYDIGIEIEVKVPLAEATLSNFNTAIPKSLLRSDRITVGGFSDDDNTISAEKLILIPIVTNTTSDVPWTIYLAAVKDIKPIRWEIDIKTLEITLAGQIDETRPKGDQLFRIGGPAS